MYTVRFQPECNLLDIAWHGLFEPDEVATYARECLEHVRRAGVRPGYRLRIDMTGSAVQPRATLAAFEHCFHSFPKAGRIAIVTPSALYRLQVLRIMTQPYLRVFDTAEVALEWLLHAEPDAGVGNVSPGRALLPGA